MEEREKLMIDLEAAYAAWEAAEAEARPAAQLRRAVDEYRKQFSPAYFAGSRMRHWARAAATLCAGEGKDESDKEDLPPDA